MHPLSDFNIRQEYGRQMIKKMDEREISLIKVLQTYFNGQEDRVVEALDAQNFDKGFMKKELLDDVFSIDQETKIAIDVVLPILQQFLMEAGEDSKLISGSTFEFFLSDEIESWLDQKVEIFRNINETTYRQLSREFAISLSEQENRNQLIKRVKDTFGNISKKRAATIARTEILGATQKGTYEGYRQAGLQTKIWVAVMDSRVRDSHAMQDGEERPINDRFTNGQLFPGDPSVGDPGEFINCRCTI